MNDSDAIDYSVFPAVNMISSCNSHVILMLSDVYDDGGGDCVITDMLVWCDSFRRVHSLITAAGKTVALEMY